MLSKRLNAIAEMVDTNVLYDVGCDHALLDIYLVQTKKNIKVIAPDINNSLDTYYVLNNSVISPLSINVIAVLSM